MKINASTLIIILMACIELLLVVVHGNIRADDCSADWYGPQAWKRDRDIPSISLGSPGDFDDTHIFAPCVAFENNIFSMWYCGSRGKNKLPLYELGMATSKDGVNFIKHPQAPVLSLADKKCSILTPTLLRYPNGSVCRENRKLRMWFSSLTVRSGKALYALHDTTSVDGLSWTTPSDAQLKNVYAPTIILENGLYRMWYVDVSKKPWAIKYAQSNNGSKWHVYRKTVMTIDQKWEHKRLFYPTVLKSNDLYLMWYGSYEKSAQTALGFAVSKDGIVWNKNPFNPVFIPNPSQYWESHYTSSQSIMALPDGSWRIWYASRSKPAFKNKYFAIGTARWKKWDDLIYEICLRNAIERGFLLDFYLIQ